MSLQHTKNVGRSPQTTKSVLLPLNFSTTLECSFACILVAFRKCFSQCFANIYTCDHSLISNSHLWLYWLFCFSFSKIKVIWPYRAHNLYIIWFHWLAQNNWNRNIFDLLIFIYNLKYNLGVITWTHERMKWKLLFR